MLELNRRGLADEKAWQAQGIRTPSFDFERMLAETARRPVWVHFGPGNIFRAFIAALQQTLLEAGVAEAGIIAVAPYEDEVIAKIYRPHDALTLLATMHADGRLEKQIIGSVAEALVCDRNAPDWARLQAVFESPSLQIASFTITEKGYKLRDYTGAYAADAAADLAAGPKRGASFMGRVAALLYRRFLTGGAPLALLSLDNCARNGEKLKGALLEFAARWEENGLTERGFLTYLQSPEKVAFPCSMIDKITPRPSERVRAHLKACGLRGADFVYTARGSCYAPFVNAEKTQYLVIEDTFPNGRPLLEKAGVLFSDLETVDRVERMKVCACLNPLHTALAVYGCLLGYTRIADEKRDAQLRRLVERIGYDEGLAVIDDPGVIQPADFLREVL